MDGELPTPVLECVLDAAAAVMRGDFPIDEREIVPVNHMSFVEFNHVPSTARMQLIASIERERRVAEKSVRFCIELIEASRVDRVIALSIFPESDEPLWNSLWEHTAVSHFYSQLPRPIIPLYSGGVGKQLESMLRASVHELLGDLSKHVNGGRFVDAATLSSTTNAIAAAAVDGGSGLPAFVDSQIHAMYTSADHSRAAATASAYTEALLDLERLLLGVSCAGASTAAERRLRTVRAAETVAKQRRVTATALSVQRQELGLAMRAMPPKEQAAVRKLKHALAEAPGLDEQLVARLLVEAASGPRVRAVAAAVRGIRQQLAVGIALTVDAAKSNSYPHDAPLAFRSVARVGKPTAQRGELELPDFFAADRAVFARVAPPAFCPLRADIIARFALTQEQRDCIRLLLATKQLVQEQSLGQQVAPYMLRAAAARSMQQSKLALERIATACRVHSVTRGVNVHHQTLGLNAVLADPDGPLAAVFDDACRIVSRVSTADIQRTWLRLRHPQRDEECSAGSGRGRTHTAPHRAVAHCRIFCLSLFVLLAQRASPRFGPRISTSTTACRRHQCSGAGRRLSHRAFLFSFFSFSTARRGHVAGRYTAFGFANRALGTLVPALL